jgi:hypothetical protein
VQRFECPTEIGRFVERRYDDSESNGGQATQAFPRWKAT